MEQTKIKGPSRSFPSILDEAMLAKQEADKLKEPYFPLRPSSSGYCSRRIANDYAAYLGQRERLFEEKKPSVIRLLNFGHSVETHSLRNLELIPGYSIRYKQQTVMLWKLPVSGRWVEGSIDAFLVGQGDAGVMDVKSVGSRFDSAFADSWAADIARIKNLRSVEVMEDGLGVWVEDLDAFLAELGEHALVANCTQVNLYALSEFAKEHGCNWGSIYRYGKNKSDHFEVRFKPSEKLYAATQAKYETIDRAVVGQRNPLLVKKDYVIGSMACSYCPYRPECYPQASRKDIYQAYPPKNWATKVEQLEGRELVSQLFNDYTAKLQVGAEAATIEQKLLTELEAHGVDRIKLEDGSVWEVKELKSPKPHRELRRSKE